MRFASKAHLRTYAESFDTELYHYQDYGNHEIDAVIEMSDGRWAAIEVKLGVNQEDVAAENLKAIRRQLESAHLQPPEALIVAVGLASAAYRRKDGVYVVPRDPPRAD